MQKTALLFLLLIMGLLSCKKKNSTHTFSYSSTTSTGGGTTGATLYDGFLSTRNFTIMHIGGFLQPWPVAQAYFTSPPVLPGYAPTPTTSIKAGSVYMNGDSLTYNSTLMYQYYPAGPSLSSTAQTWMVNGANGVPSFTYTNTNLEPTCSGFSGIPDSVSKSGGFSVTVNNVANLTGGNVVLFDFSTAFFPLIKPIQAGNNTVVFSPSEIASVGTGTNAGIAILITNEKAVTLSGKNFLFSRIAHYSKDIKIKN